MDIQYFRYELRFVGLEDFRMPVNLFLSLKSLNPINLSSNKWIFNTSGMN
jgi:hypothetical protein